MIRDKIHRTISVALARLGEAYRIKQAAVDDEVLSAGWDRKMGEVCEAQAWLDNLPQPPEPDWSEAPEWAQWWAVDADGTAVWYEAEPFVEAAPFVSVPFMWDWNYPPRTQNKIDKVLHIPIGIDWRTTLRRRPQPETQHG